jgi:peptide deformylase
VLVGAVSVRPLRLFGDPVLRTECDPVTRFDDALAGLVEDLLDTVQVPGRAGLAAPQIGVGLAAFSYNVDGRLGYVINPRIVELSGTYAGLEACLSVPGVAAETPRSAYALVAGVDRSGKPVEVGGEGEMARCLQHETDHLRGMLYLDRLTGEARRSALRQLRGGQPRAGRSVEPRRR